MIQSIYITRAIGDVLQLRNFCIEHGIKLTALSQISFAKNKFIVRKPYEVVLFTSPRSAAFFFNFQSIPAHVKIACVGPGTASYLEKKGFVVDFTGPVPGDPVQNARYFADWLGIRSVLFPQSNLGMSSMSKFLSPAQFEHVQVYSTEFHSEIIPPHEVYIFTSPSNVESFLVKNQRPEGKIIAWGKSTEQALMANDVNVSYTLSTSAENEVINYLVSRYAI